MDDNFWGIERIIDSDDDRFMNFFINFEYFFLLPLEIEVFVMTK